MTSNIQMENLVELLENENVKIVVRCYSHYDSSEHNLTSYCNVREIVEIGTWFSVTGFTNKLIADQS